jgi:hypothetical protein
MKPESLNLCEPSTRKFDWSSDVVSADRLWPGGPRCLEESEWSIRASITA